MVKEMGRHRYSKDGKVEAIKEFMQQLYERGIILRLKRSRTFEYYCKWAGGEIVRIELGYNRAIVACVNSALLYNLSKDELTQRIIVMYEEEMQRQQQLLELLEQYLKL